MSGTGGRVSGGAIRLLSTAEIATDSFRRLLWRAAEVDDAALAAIVSDELPELTVLGIVDDDGPVGFVAFGARDGVMEIDYIAVSERAAGQGWGRALVDAVRARAGDRPLRAETDDDAVDFYRRLGFAVRAAGGPDPRWPDRRRYDCLLSAR
jgi:ribosomal protein S18 acetylase RimI-like enzyme